MQVAHLKAAARAIYGRLAAPGQIRFFLKQPGLKRLNLGCGHNVLSGWLNVDLEGGRGGKTFMNALRSYPLPDNSLDAILCEHLIEHLPAEGGRFLLSEAFRVLKPDGVIRVITPDLEGLARLCVNGPLSPAEENYLQFVADLHGRTKITPSDALNYIFYEYGHRHIYTIARLREAMAVVGFVNLREGRAGAPPQGIFAGAEGHPNFMGIENDAVEAFAIEGAKPSLARLS